MKIIITGLILLTVGFVLGKLDVQEARANQQNYTLETCMTQLDKSQVSKSARGWAFWFVQKDLTGGLNVKMSQVGPQQAHHGAHSHESSEVFYILQGNAEFTLEGESTIVGPNSTLYCPSNVPHGIRNAGSDSLRYLVIKNN